jgi:hypothetical protein
MILIPAFLFARSSSAVKMTKSEMQWEDNLDAERASNIARRFAIEDLALKYRTTLKTAEQLLATGMVAERQTRVKSPKSPDVIEIDDSPRKVKVEMTQEDMEVDVEGPHSSQSFSRETDSLKQEAGRQPTGSRSPFDQACTSPRSERVFSFPERSATANHVSAFQRHSYPTPRFSSQTWPYCVTYPYLTRNGTLARNYPFLCTSAGAKPVPSYLPFELLKHRYRLAVGRSRQERSRVFGTQEERHHAPLSPAQRPRTFVSSEERLKTFAPLREERPQAFAPSENGLRTSVPRDERPRVLTLEEEKERFLYDKRSRVFAKEGETSELYEQRPRSYTPPSARRDFTTGHPKTNTTKPRRHSDDAVTNSNRPSVLVMQRSLSNPTGFGKAAKHGANDETCACSDEHQSDSDSSETPPLATESPSSNDANNTGKISGIFE